MSGALLAFFGCFLSFLCGVGVMYATEFFDQEVHKPHHSEEEEQWEEFLNYKGDE